MREDILDGLRELLRSNFEDEGLVITADTVLDDIEDWDSMEMVAVISMTESYYGIHYSVEETIAMSNAKTVAEMVDIISQKL